jgi:hypothetical protein
MEKGGSPFQRTLVHELGLIFPLVAHLRKFWSLQILQQT